MNYFYFFLFLFFSIIILFKPLAKTLFDWVINSKKLYKLGFITSLIGAFCIYISLMDSFWYERVWMVVTLILGILIFIRGVFIIFFLDTIKKLFIVILKNYYKFTIPISLTMFFLAFFIVSTDYIGPQKDISSCRSDSVINVICDFYNPEDIVITPDKEFLLMSEFGGIGPYEEQKSGYFALLELSSGKKIIPNIVLGDNSWGNPSCSRNNLKFGPHGIDLIQRSDGMFQLGVINHFPEETVEMFQIVKNGKSWDFIWKGCIDVPYRYYFNDVSLQKNGNFFATHMYKRDINLNVWLINTILKRKSGLLVNWQNNKFTDIRGSEGSGPNGIALHNETNMIYINYNQGDKISKFDLISNEIVASKFIESPDNPYIDSENIWVTSLDFQPNDFGECEFKKSCSLPFSIYKLDLISLDIIDKYSFSKTVFGLPTVAVPFKENIYLGSFHSDRIGYFKID